MRLGSRHSESSRLLIKLHSKPGMLGCKHSPETLAKMRRAKSGIPPTDDRDARRVYNRTNQLRKYGLTVVEFDRMYQIQQGCCAICKRHQTAVGKILEVDHDHKTGKVRGLLCRSCNLTIGYVKEDTTTLQSAISYLSYWKSIVVRSQTDDN